MSIVFDFKDIHGRLKDDRWYEPKVVESEPEPEIKLVRRKGFKAAIPQGNWRTLNSPPSIDDEEEPVF